MTDLLNSNWVFLGPIVTGIYALAGVWLAARSEARGARG